MCNYGDCTLLDGVLEFYVGQSANAPGISQRAFCSSCRPPVVLYHDSVIAHAFRLRLPHSLCVVILLCASGDSPQSWQVVV